MPRRSTRAAAAACTCNAAFRHRLLAGYRGASTAAAERRNAADLAAGKVEFLVRDLEYLDLGSRQFDLVFAVRVGLFHREPQRARALVEPWLAPGGRVEAFYDSPSS